MATTPVLEAILAQLQSELGAVAKADGYSQDVGGRCLRAWPNEANIKGQPQPAVYLFCGPTRKVIGSFQTDAVGLGAVGEQTHITLLNVVFLALCKGTDRETIGQHFSADIEAILVGLDGQERVIASTTVSIVARVVDLYTQDIYGTQAGGHFQFDLTHTTRLGRPRTGTA